MELITIPYMVNLTKEEAKVLWDAEMLLEEILGKIPDFEIGEFKHFRTSFQDALNCLIEVNCKLNVHTKLGVDEPESNY